MRIYQYVDGDSVFGVSVFDDAQLTVGVQDRHRGVSLVSTLPLTEVRKLRDALTAHLDEHNDFTAQVVVDVPPLTEERVREIIADVIAKR